MKTNGKRTNKPGKTYPESSTRQALRGFRRAQGGPGLTTGKNPTPVGGFAVVADVAVEAANDSTAE